METYDFKKAREQIVKASIQKDTVELPTIMSCFPFRDVEALEYSRRADARLAVSFNGIFKHVTFLVKREDNAEKARQLISSLGLEKRIAVASCEDPAKSLDIEERTFDLVYGEWLSHELTRNPGFLEQLIRHSRKYILLVMPGIRGDEPKLISLVNPGEKEKREKVKEEISQYLSSKGWEVKYKEGMLRLDFESAEDARKTFYCMAFNNQLTDEQKRKVNRFLNERRAHNFKDGFYVLWAEKK